MADHGTVPRDASRRWPRSAATGALLGTLAMLAWASVALGAAAVKSATYKGTVPLQEPAITIMFKVSSNGKRLTDLRLSNTPLYCSGGGITPIHFKDATISSKGTFKSTGEYIIAVGPNKGHVGSKLSITGAFKRGGRESGKVKTTYPSAPSCSGQSNYSTKVVKRTG